MLYIVTVDIIFYKQMLNWLFGHYSTLTTLLGKIYITNKKT